MNLRFHFAFIPLLTLLAGASPAAHAATINWGTPTGISADTDVSTAGTLITAIHFDSSNTLVNGVTFLGVPVTGAPTTVSFPGGNMDITSATYFVEFATGSLSGPFSQLSPGYRQLVWTSLTGNYGFYPDTLTLTGLTAGSTYQFEFWENNSMNNSGTSITATAGNSVTLNTNPSATYGYLGQYDIGTFVADGPAETIQFAAPGNVTAFELRQTAAVPEPGTAALLGVGLGTFLWRRRRA